MLVVWKLLESSLYQTTDQLRLRVDTTATFAILCFPTVQIYGDI